jgi:hypothetical protein
MEAYSYVDDAGAREGMVSFCATNLLRARGSNAVLDLPTDNMPLESPIAEVSMPLTPSEKDELIARVAASTNFRRSLRLREFLLYVGNASIRDGVSELREQDIGVRVFGRSPDYDRGADNIVRVNATELRKRVDQYFAGEGAGEPYIFEIPRGAYKLVFRGRKLATELAQLPELDVLPDNTPLPAEVAPSYLSTTRSGRVWMWVSIGLGLLCVILTVALFRAQRKSLMADDGRRPAVMEFWRAFTRDNEPGTQTDLVLSDESLSLMQDILRRPVSLSAYVDRSYANTIDTAPVSDERKSDVHELLGHNLVTLGEVLAARQIVGLPGLSRHFHVTVPRLYPPDLMKRNNLVIVGGKKSNPWAGFFEDHLTFTLETNMTTGQNFVLNRHPVAGEAVEYHADGSSVLPGGVAVVSYIPNPNSTGEVLLLTGSDSDATAAAAEFITSESSIEQLQQKFGQSQLPHFELVLRTTRLNGTSFNSVIVTSRLR